MSDTPTAANDNAPAANDNAQAANDNARAANDNAANYAATNAEAAAAQESAAAARDGAARQDPTAATEAGTSDAPQASNGQADTPNQPPAELKPADATTAPGGANPLETQGQQHDEADTDDSGEPSHEGSGESLGETIEFAWEVTNHVLHVGMGMLPHGFAGQVGEIAELAMKNPAALIAAAQVTCQQIARGAEALMYAMLEDD